MVMISIDVDTSFDFQTTYAELLSLEGESFWSLGKSMPTPRDSSLNDKSVGMIIYY
jgi:hypothetical protein